MGSTNAQAVRNLAMWSVVLVNQSGVVVEVLSDGERELSGAIAFAAGYGQPLAGAVVVIPSAGAPSDETTPAKWLSTQR